MCICNIDLIITNNERNGWFMICEKCGTEKPVTYALDEFLSGKLQIVEPEEIRNI